MLFLVPDLSLTLTDANDSGGMLETVDDVLCGQNFADSALVRTAAAAHPGLHVLTP